MLNTPPFLALISIATSHSPVSMLISSHLNTFPPTFSPVKNNLMTFDRYWRECHSNGVQNGRALMLLPCSGAAGRVWQRFLSGGFGFPLLKDTT